MRMVSSSGKSTGKRRAICSGLQAFAHRRSCRGPCRRPFQATVGPGTAAPPGATTAPVSRSSTEVRNAAFSASFVGLGRRAARSACHCAVVARYSKPPLRVAALRRNSRESVEAARPSRRATSCMDWPCARRSAISSRSANERYRPESGLADGLNIDGGIPPACLNHRVPTACDTPAAIAASSLAIPAAIAIQNRRRSSRPVAGGRPGENRGARPDRSDRRFRPGIATSFQRVLRRPLESALAAAVAMVHQSRPLKRTPVIECLFESSEKEAVFGRSRRPPADDPPGKDVDDEGDVDEALPGRDIGEIRQPQRIRPRRMELPVYLVTQIGRRFVADRRLHRLAADRAVKTHLLHQPRRRAAGDRDPLPAQLSPDLAHAVDPEVRLPDPADFRPKPDIAPRAGWQARRIGPVRGALVIGRRSDRQQAADRLDTVALTMRGEEGYHGFDRRSSSAIAKYADALRRISLAWRSSRFSRSRALIRARSSLVGPTRSPWSRSACRTQPRNVSAVQPIFAAIEPIAAHCEA